ncbi:type II toxin-antitoxin system ParD family antitoxin [Sphingomonas endophytica]
MRDIHGIGERRWPFADVRKGAMDIRSRRASASPSPPDRRALGEMPRRSKVDNLCQSADAAGMATMNISLPDAMKDWVEQQAATGRYSNSSDVVRDLIRREQVRAEKIANMQRLIDEGRASGVSERSPEERRIEARRRARLIVAADGI